MASRKQKVVDFGPVTSADWAYLAGIMDGEGCISIKAVTGVRNKNVGRYSLLAHVANVDTRLITWLRDKFGGYVHYYPAAKTVHRNHWVWRVQSSRCEAVLRNCLPYLIAKREQADVALSFCETLRTVGACRLGVPEEVAIARREHKERLTALKHAIFPPVAGVKSKYLQ